MKKTLPDPMEYQSTSTCGPLPDFDRLAGPYRWLEYLTFGPLLQRTRTHFLCRLGACRNALVLGDGDGRFTAALLRANPAVRVHAVDLSCSMLRALTGAAGSHHDRLTTEQADLRHWTPAPAQPHELIACHFFLDCLTTPEIAALADRLNKDITPDALWIVSDFAVPPTLYGRLVAAPLVAVLYRAFRLLTGLQTQSLPDHATALTAAGWTRESHRASLGGLLFCEIWRRSPCISSTRTSVSSNTT